MKRNSRKIPKWVPDDIREELRKMERDEEARHGNSTDEVDRAFDLACRNGMQVVWDKLYSLPVSKFITERNSEWGFELAELINLTNCTAYLHSVLAAFDKPSKLGTMKQSERDEWLKELVTATRIIQGKVAGTTVDHILHHLNYEMEDNFRKNGYPNYLSCLSKRSVGASGVVDYLIGNGASLGAFLEHVIDAAKREHDRHSLGATIKRWDSRAQRRRLVIILIKHCLLYFGETLDEVIQDTVAAIYPNQKITVKSIRETEAEVLQGPETVILET